MCPFPLQYVFSVAIQSKSGLERLICRVSKSYTSRYTQTVELFRTNEQLDAPLQYYCLGNFHAKKKKLPNPFKLSVGPSGTPILRS